MKCLCEQEARVVTVKKEGPNTGRQFYACPKPKGEQCDFFEWLGEYSAGVTKILERLDLLERQIRDVYELVKNR